MCVCVLSPSFSFILHSGGSNVCYFFNTWPCLFGRTYQRRLVGTSLPLPAYLPTVPVWSGLVKCLQTALRFLFISLFFSRSFSFSWPAWMDCTSPYLFISIFTRLSFSVRPPCTTTTTTTPSFNNLTFWRAPSHSPGIPRDRSHVCVPVSVSEAQIDELGKWNEARCSWHLIERGEWTRSTEEGKTGLNKGRREGWRFHEKQKELYVYVRGRNCVCCMCYRLFNLVSPLMQ